MPDKYFKATLQATAPSHSAGQKMTVYGVSLTGQTVKEQAIRIGLLKGLGASKVVSVHVYKDGNAWYKAQHGRKAQAKRRSTVKCPSCKNTDTEPSWGAEGYMQCNSCGAEFQHPKGHTVKSSKSPTHAKVFQVDYKKFRLNHETRMLSKGSDGDFWVSGYDVLSGPETVGFIWKEEHYWRAIAWRYKGIGKGYENSLAVTIFKTKEDAARWVAKGGK